MKSNQQSKHSGHLLEVIGPRGPLFAVSVDWFEGTGMEIPKVLCLLIRRGQGVKKPVVDRLSMSIQMPELVRDLPRSVNFTSFVLKSKCLSCDKEQMFANHGFNLIW